MKLEPALLQTIRAAGENTNSHQSPTSENSMKPSLPNLRHGETYTEWAKRRLQESFVENVSLFDAVIAPLIGYAIALELEMQNRSADRAKELNRRVDVESALLDFAAGKRGHFTPEEARALAYKLGVPPAEPKEQTQLPL